MAKLADKKWCRKNAAGDIVKFTSSVTVDHYGIFRMSFPEYLVPIFKSLPKGGRVEHSRGADRISAESLVECNSLIAVALDEYLACEITKEIVIAYALVSSCKYVKNSLGGIFPNGYHSRDDYRWSEEHGNSNEPYVLGFRAEVVTKEIAKRGSSSKVKYERVEEKDLGEWGKKLNEFPNTQLRYCKEVKELPYTEEAAKFFYQSMMNLCHLADSLTQVLADPQKVLALTGTPALLPKNDKEVLDA